MVPGWTRGKFQRHSTKHETSALSCDVGGPLVPLVDHMSIAAPCASGQFLAPSQEGQQGK